MARAYPEVLKPVVDHVTELLMTAITLRYNEHFYRNGADDLWEALCRKYGADPDGLAPAILVDSAVWHLERDGYVVTRKLPEKMGDGEPDYEITVTTKYLDFLADGGEIAYADIELEL